MDKTLSLLFVYIRSPSLPATPVGKSLWICQVTSVSSSMLMGQGPNHTTLEPTRSDHMVTGDKGRNPAGSLHPSLGPFAMPITGHLAPKGLGHDLVTEGGPVSNDLCHGHN